MHIYVEVYIWIVFGSRELLRITGVIIFLLMILTAFLGYILPWGQMSLGEQQYNKFSSTIPVIGDRLFYGFGVV
jgi:ubiquinol-cytochrome c reductase cytochrome b subunit